MDSREGGPEEPVSESEDGTSRRGGLLIEKKGSMGMGREGSIAGGIWKPPPKHLGHKTGCLCGCFPPCEWGPVDLHWVLTDSMLQGPLPKLVPKLVKVYPLVSVHFWWPYLPWFSPSQLCHIWEVSNYLSTVNFSLSFPPPIWLPVP